MDTDQEAVAQIARRYHLLVVPVVDRGGRLVGSIDAHDVLDILLAKRESRQSRRRYSSTGMLARPNEVLRQRLHRWRLLLRLRFWRP
jgi:Mg/Co/Ni transporter MgtE